MITAAEARAETYEKALKQIANMTMTTPEGRRVGGIAAAAVGRPTGGTFEDRRPEWTQKISTTSRR